MSDLKENLEEVGVITLLPSRINPKHESVLRKHPDLYASVIAHTSFLVPHATIRERLYAIINDLDHQPTCKGANCTKEVSFHLDGRHRNTYRIFCSLKCSNSADSVKQKKKQTCLINHGVTNPSLSPSIHTKKQQTCLKNHGVRFPQQNADIRSKTVDRVRSLYGMDNVMMHEDVRRKNIQSKQSYFDHLYDVEPHLQKLTDKQWLIDQHHTQQKSSQTTARELQTSSTTVLRWLHRHDIPIKHHFKSELELEVVEQLKNMGIDDIRTSCRDVIAPYELDIVCGDIAIELNGIFWHSTDTAEGGRITKNYHLNKTEMCERCGIRLIHIFESEWRNRREIVISRLRSIFSRKMDSVYARKTTVRPVDTKQAREFLDQHHIQGAKTGINYGLFLHGELVSLATFGKCRYGDYQYELLRYCSKTDVKVVGGASKLFKHFINIHQPDTVVSYSDRRWSQGDVYLKLGFEFKHHSAPNYFYIDPKRDIFRLHNRVNFQKHKLRDKLSVFDPNLTEMQNMWNNGYRTIWDCGNSVWVWNPTSTTNIT